MTFPAGPELIVILFIVLLLFGARKLPELGKGVGEFVKGIRQATDD
jgi:sec-independent protein translocase protein TatA